MTPLPPKDGLAQWWHHDTHANCNGGTESPCYDCGADCAVTCDWCGRPICDACHETRHRRLAAEAYPCPLASMPDVPDTPQE